MEPIVSALIGGGALLVSNVTMFAFFYGKLSQRVEGNSERIKRIEGILNGWLEAHGG
jgi:hypothetical protein